MLQMVSTLSFRFVLWVEDNIQIWPHCRLKIVYCYGLRTWFFGWTPWIDADQTFTICTSLLRDTMLTRAWEWHVVLVTHEAPPLLPFSSSSAWIGGCEWAKYRSNNASLCNVLYVLDGAVTRASEVPSHRQTVCLGLLGSVQRPSLR